MSNKIVEIIEKLPESERQIINILNKVQEKHGFIPQLVLSEMAAHLEIPESQLYGLVSFFEYFRTRPAGKHRISLCYGTACYARGAPLIYDRLVDELNLDADGTSEDGLVTVDKVYCVGACSRAPIIVEDGEIKGKIKSHQVPFIIEELRDKQ